MHVLAAAGGGSDTLLGVLGVIGIFIAYWAPTVIAVSRHVPGWGQVVVVNVFGFLVITWVVALVMAFRPVPAATGSAGG